MKVPKIFTLENQKELKSEIEKIVRETLVDKILVEDIAKELEAYFESRNLAERIEVSFEKAFDLTKDKNLKPSTQQKSKYSYRVYLDKGAKNDLQRQERNRILNHLRELAPDIKEEEITNEYDNTFSVVTKDFAYELWFKVNEFPQDGKIIEKEKDVTVKRRFRGEQNETKTISWHYQNLRIKGKIEYAKFDKGHNETLLKILQEQGYLYSVDIKERVYKK